MTHNDADRSLVDDATSTRQFAHVPAQSEEPPPPPIVRPKRRKLPIATMILALAAVGGIGFYSGVRVEKNQITPTASSRTGSTAFNFGSGSNAANRSSATASPSPGASAAPGGTGGSGTFGGATTTTGGAANIVGTVTVIQGDTLYVTETSTGDVVKVTTSDGTTVTKTDTGTVKDLAPGETVVIRGVQSSDGVYAAQTVTQGSATAGLAGGFGGFGGGGRGGAGRAGATASATASPKAGS
jgi:hypothetical protein